MLRESRTQTDSQALPAFSPTCPQFAPVLQCAQIRFTTQQLKVGTSRRQDSSLPECRVGAGRLPGGRCFAPTWTASHDL